MVLLKLRQLRMGPDFKRILSNVEHQRKLLNIACDSSYSFIVSNALCCVSLAQWSFLVKQRNGWKCMLSGKKETRLESHHLFSKKRFPSLKLTLLNGIPLKLYYHHLFHKTYGYHTTLDDFVSFLCMLEYAFPTKLDLAQLKKLKIWLEFIKPILQNNLEEPL
jgi:hypothetical protein